jgi:RNA polymerase sigma-70 factor, ECF subfamily
MDQLEEQEIISAILDGEVDAYAMLVNRYRQAVYNMAYRMTGSQADAADLTQDAFIKAYEQLYRFQEGKKFFPWLYTIALNHTRNFLRKSKTSKTIAVADCAVGYWDLHTDSQYAAEEEDKICGRLDCQRLQSALIALPWKYREAVILRYREELPMEDIATALSISVSGAKMRVHRGLKKLRNILELKDDGNRNTFSSTC